MLKNFFPKIVPFIRQRGKISYSRIGHGWQYSTAHAHCMLDNLGCKHELRICNTYCFSQHQCLRDSASPLCYTYIACRSVAKVILASKEQFMPKKGASWLKTSMALFGNWLWKVSLRLGSKYYSENGSEWGAHLAVLMFAQHTRN